MAFFSLFFTITSCSESASDIESEETLIGKMTVSDFVALMDAQPNIKETQVEDLQLRMDEDVCPLEQFTCGGNNTLYINTTVTISAPAPYSSCSFDVPVRYSLCIIDARLSSVGIEILGDYNDWTFLDPANSSCDAYRNYLQSLVQTPSQAGQVNFEQEIIKLHKLASVEIKSILMNQLLPAFGTDCPGQIATATFVERDCFAVCFTISDDVGDGLPGILRVDRFVCGKSCCRKRTAYCLNPETGQAEVGEAVYETDGVCDEDPVMCNQYEAKCYAPCDRLSI